MYVQVDCPVIETSLSSAISVRYVGSSTRWGNPWRVKYDIDEWWQVGTGGADGRAWIVDSVHRSNEEAVLAAVEKFRWWYTRQMAYLNAARAIAPLVGADVLSCWCPLDSPCHADVLCELVGRLKSGGLVSGLVATPGVCGGALRIECTNWSVATVADDVRRFARCEDWTLDEAVYALAIDLEVDPEVVHAAVFVAGYYE